ncbi:MAG: division/cell wall cluster transcriptional repressor MraZ [Bacilli bacterium]
MFFGSFAHTLDDKGRLVIPRKMREEIGVKAFIMKGFDGALSIYKASEFEKLVQEFNTLSFNKKNSRDYLRVQLASVSELEVDKSGRVQIPAQMLTKFQIGKEVMVIGMGDHIEVWNQTDFTKYEKDAISSFEKTAEDLDSAE